MTVFSAIYRRLAAVSGITALVGTSPSRIWESEAKNGTLPAIVIEVDLEMDPALQKRPADHYTVTVSVIAGNPDDRATLESLISTAIARHAWTDEDIQIVSVGSPNAIGSADAESGSGTGSNAEAMYFQSIASYEVIAGTYPFVTEVSRHGGTTWTVTFNITVDDLDWSGSHLIVSGNTYNYTSVSGMTVSYNTGGGSPPDPGSAYTLSNAPLTSNGQTGTTV